jgi:hypothetical protein
MKRGRTRPGWRMVEATATTGTVLGAAVAAAVVRSQPERGTELGRAVALVLQQQVEAGTDTASDLPQQAAVQACRSGGACSGTAAMTRGARQKMQGRGQRTEARRRVRRPASMAGAAPAATAAGATKRPSRRNEGGAAPGRPLVVSITSR